MSSCILYSSCTIVYMLNDVAIFSEIRKKETICNSREGCQIIGGAGYLEVQYFLFIYIYSVYDNLMMYN